MWNLFVLLVELSDISTRTNSFGMRLAKSFFEERNDLCFDLDSGGGWWMSHVSKVSTGMTMFDKMNSKHMGLGFCDVFLVAHWRFACELSFSKRLPLKSPEDSSN